MDVLTQLQEQSQHFFWSPKIKILHIEGRGNSVVCTEPLDPNELLIHVPADLLINVSTIEERFPEKELLPHEILALELVERLKVGKDAWVNTLPKKFESMPISWNSKDQERLPPRNLQRVVAQRKEINDFAAKCLLPLDAAEWAWKAVNTRCLYWHKGGMTLAPAIDYLNHTCIADTNALLVKPSARGISVYTQSGHKPGNELTFCYGPHENGFLLVEYGFLVPNNPWNFADITNMILPLVEPHRKWLSENNYWGDWTIDNDGEPSFRVEVALATLQAPIKALNRLVAGYDDGSRYNTKNHAILKSVASDLKARHKSICAERGVRPEIMQLYHELDAILSKV